MSWYFYNAPYSIDAPETCSKSILDAGTVLSSYTLPSSLLLVSPNPAWRPFNPSDNYWIQRKTQTSVGYRRELFEVVENTLKPIYWNLNVKVPIRKAKYVFSSTQTPLPPEWEMCAENLWDRQSPASPEYAGIFKEAQSRCDFAAIGAPIIINKNKCKLLFLPGPHQKAYILSLHQSQSKQFLANIQSRLCQAVEITLFDYGTYKQKNKLGDLQSDNIDYTPPPITHLTLAVHGIGQHHTAPTEGRNFTYVVDRLRERILKESRATDEHHALLLPVIWRPGFNIENDHFSIQSIIPSFAVELRERIYDFFNDVPYYMGTHRDLMVKAVVDQANKTVELFRERHPYFDGPIHIIGHSLGAMIVADVLSQQPTNVQDPALDPPTKSRFDFNVHNFYTLGSPMGLFLYLRNAQLVPRSRLDGPMPPFGCLAVSQIYNIVHPYDVVATLLNPTVVGGSSQEPSPLPQKKESGWFFTRRKEKPTPELEENENLGALNKSGQLDWVLSCSTKFEILTTALNAHSSYWVSQDLARFIIDTGFCN